MKNKIIKLTLVLVVLSLLVMSAFIFVGCTNSEGEDRPIEHMEGRWVLDSRVTTSQTAPSGYITIISPFSEITFWADGRFILVPTASALQVLDNRAGTFRVTGNGRLITEGGGIAVFDDYDYRVEIDGDSMTITHSITPNWHNIFRLTRAGDSGEFIDPNRPVNVQSVVDALRADGWTVTDQTIQGTRTISAVRLSPANSALSMWVYTSSSMADIGFSTAQGAASNWATTASARRIGNVVWWGTNNALLIVRDNR